MRNNRNFRVVRMLILVCVGLLMNKLANAQPLSVTLGVSSCNTITANVSGATGTVIYSINHTNWVSGNTFPALAPGPYTIWVNDDLHVETTASTNITNPASFSVALSKSTVVICAPCTGSLAYTISGGTPPYDKPSPATGLCVGANQTIVITDAHGCQATSSLFEVKTDVATPIFRNEDFPPKYFKPVADYDIENNEPFNLELPGNTYIRIDDTLKTDLIDLSNYSNASVTLTASQNNMNLWGNNDFMKIEVSYDGGSTFAPYLWIDKCILHGGITSDATGEGVSGQTGNSSLSTVGPIPLGGFADFNATIMLRVVMHMVSDVSLEYTINSLTVQANQRYHKIDPLESGEPVIVDPDDLTYSITPTYTDVIHWICQTPGSEEFYVVRTWTGKDGCNKSVTVSRNQFINVGTPPFFPNGIPRDTIFDFCDTVKSFNAPIANDGCSNSSSILVTWRIIDNVTPDIFTSGQNNIESYSFHSDKSYTIRWIATDQAYISDSMEQQVTFQQPISADISLAPENICVNGKIIFTVSPYGGTGSFNATSFNPPGGTWNQSSLNYSYFPTFTTSSGGVPEHLNFIITDLTINGIRGIIGNCPSKPIPSPDFSVHELIKTNPIQKD
jgi:hypothetical protein